MLIASLTAILLAAGTEMMIPEGTILPVILNETLNTAKVQDNDPVLFSLADDVRSSGHRGPVLIPRGSNVVGRVVRSQRAGHFIGRSHMDIAVQEIITPTGDVYDGVSARIIDVGKRKGEKGEVKADGGIQGPVHRTRDTILLLFPPTTLFQLLSIPKRGPDVVLPVETRLFVKLMTPIYVETRPALAAAVSSTALGPTPFTPAPVIPAPAPFPQPVMQPLSTAYQPLSTAYTLESLLAPVALYPDAILRDLFPACAYPLEIVQANQWVHQIRDVAGSLPRNGYDYSWHSSVRALTAYPDLLQRLGTDVNWMTRVGTAFSADPLAVMNAVARLRTQPNYLH